MSVNDNATLEATCQVCGGRFSMTDKQDRVFAAYKVWDSEHQHTDPKES